MAPKSAKKAVAVSGKAKKQVPASPIPDDADDNSVPPTPSTAEKTKKERKPPKVFQKLDSGSSGAVPVDVTYEEDPEVNDSTVSKLHPKDGHVHTLKLKAPESFQLVNSYLLENGMQAIILKPSKPLPLLKLPKEFRVEVLRLLLTPDNKYKRIEVATDKSGGVKSSNYNDKINKHRTGLMLSNKEFAEEGLPILYGFKFRFENTTALLNFLSVIGKKAQDLISNISMQNYVKVTALASMTLLADCNNLENVHIISGVGINTSAEKAAKSFFSESGRLLQALAQKHGGDKDAPLSIVTFGKNCFTTKDKEEDAVYRWADEEVEAFAEAIKAKLK